VSRLGLARAAGAALLCATYPTAAWPLTPAQVYAKVAKLVVVVEAQDAQGRRRAQGSGVIVGAGEVVTNCHVALRAEKVVVRSEGTRHDAARRYTDEQRDLCQLRVPTLGLPSAPAPFANASPGDHVFAIGAPQGLELTLSDGLISGLRQINGVSVLQTTAPISPGSSGGGLFNDSGYLVGITTFQMGSGQNLNFALPARSVSELAARHARAQGTLASTAFAAEWKAQDPQRPSLAETGAFIEESVRAFGRAANLPLNDGATMEIVLGSVSVRDCRMRMEREVVTTRGSASSTSTATEVLIDLLRFDVKGLTPGLLEPGPGVTLATDPKTPFAARRSLFPAVRKFTESTENRFVIYLTDPAAALRVRNAFSNLILSCGGSSG
jgi:S1-C subfamily serine protease